MATEYLVLRKGSYLTDRSRAWSKVIGQPGGSQGQPGSILIAVWLRAWFDQKTDKNRHPVPLTEEHTPWGGC